MVDLVLNECIKRGFFLDKEVLEIFKSMKLEKRNKIIDLLSSSQLKEKVITKRVLVKNKSLLENVLQKNGVNFEELLEINYIPEVKKDLTEKNFKVVKEPEFVQKIFEINDFSNLFRQKYNILKEKFVIDNYTDMTSIRKLPNSGSFSIITTVYDKKNTKNKNILLCVEDLTKDANIVIPRSNSHVYELAQKVFLDDVILIRGNVVDNLLIANDIVFPEIKLPKEKTTKGDCYIAFIGDIHCGSNYFLEKNFLKFIKWINNTEEIKYLFIGGDIIDGVGQYYGQEKDLSIKTISGQYKKFQELLNLFRQNLQIFIIPGNRDSIWIGEPQPKFNINQFGEFKNYDNISFVGNPSIINIEDSVNILLYHGMNIYNLINEKKELKDKYGYNSPNILIKDLLNSRQLSPEYGFTDTIIDKNASLVLDIIPDIILTSHFHRCNVDVKNNILMVNGSCWIKNPKYFNKKGIESEYCKVPIINLKNREIKIMDFNNEVE